MAWNTSEKCRGEQNSEKGFTYLKRSNFMVNFLYSNLTCTNITALTNQINHQQRKSILKFFLKYNENAKLKGSYKYDKLAGLDVG